jgi:hypothetical protein
MTETKEDIQAQIDRLRLEWLENMEQSPRLRGGRRSAAFPWYSFPLVKGATYTCLSYGFYHGVTSLFWALDRDYGALELGVAVTLCLSPLLIFVYLVKAFRPTVENVNLYKGALSEFESKRAELQAKLDALN